MLALAVPDLIKQLPSLVFTVVGLGLLIAAHEFGHLLVARWMGMRVDVYSIGFGNRLWGFRRGDTDYRISAFPLGGYCSIAGMSVADPAAQDPNDTGSYVNKAAWRRFLVIAAGPVVNWLLAVALVVGLFVSVGVPDQDTSRLSPIAGGPAAAAGMLEGDRVVAVDGRPVSRFTQMRDELLRPGGPEVHRLTVDRAGARLELSIKLVGGLMQVRALPERSVPVGLGEALPASVRYVWAATTAQVLAIADLFRLRGGASLSGPVGIVREAAVALKTGLADFVGMLSLISVGLAVFNFVPIPALDGGRLVFLIYELVTRRRVNQKIEEAVTVAGGLLLLALLAGVTLFGDLGLASKLMKLLHR
jgi:regulator of sigma E protease